jgi:hypothetical protein
VVRDRIFEEPKFEIVPTYQNKLDKQFETIATRVIMSQKKKIQ